MTMTADKINTEELAFTREDFAYEISWQKFLHGERLRPLDFKDEDKYTIYFLLELELVDYAVVIISGLKGSGKSLFDTWISYKLKQLFGKGATLSYRPKDSFGEYEYINEQLFIDEWVKLTELADREDSNSLIENLRELTRYSAFYNRAIAFDEARKWVWKRKPNAKLLGYIGELVDLVRHNHNVILFSCPSADKVVDEITIWDNRTHEIHCGFNTTYLGCASYQIRHRNSGKIRTLHLPANVWGQYFETHNIIGMSKPVTKKDIDDARKRHDMLGRGLKEDKGNGKGGKKNAF